MEPARIRRIGEVAGLGAMRTLGLFRFGRTLALRLVLALWLRRMPRLLAEAA